MCFELELIGMRQTPSLSDSLEHLSPPDLSAYPQTPASMPRTPPMHFYEQRV
jgi:hypothetical protein